VDRQLDAVADLPRLSERQLLERLVRTTEGWRDPQPVWIRVGTPRTRQYDPVPGPRPEHPREVESPVSVQLQDNQEVDLTADVRSAAGNPAEAASLTWSSSDESVLTVQTGDDSSKVTVVTTGTIGVATVVVSDDEDGDPSTAEFLGSLSIEVVSGPVASISVSAGEPREKS
jgi:hypothetical protein